MRAKIKIGQCWSSPSGARSFTITKFLALKAYGIDSIDNKEHSFTSIDNRHEGEVGAWFIAGYKLKVIPDMPLDPTLPVLQAGYLQDRQRKQYRSEKTK
jgi:hypothetical protein